ncbi:MAG: hypothetical protein NT079_03205 [Candidatus Omnitrophica bacterium]|nr:hypothetical protein [Candidatus Omnitrophota bacterium]
MSLKKFFPLSIIITICALFYIQMQVTIYDFAYQGKMTEDKVVKLIDGNTNRALNIAKLRSARCLGDWFFHENADVYFANRNNIVRVEASHEDTQKMRLASVSKSIQNPMNLLARVFSSRSIAEAEPIR